METQRITSCSLFPEQQPLEIITCNVIEPLEKSGEANSEEVQEGGGGASDQFSDVNAKCVIHKERLTKWLQHKVLQKAEQEQENS